MNLIFYVINTAYQLRWQYLRHVRKQVMKELN